MKLLIVLVMVGVLTSKFGYKIPVEREEIEIGDYVEIEEMWGIGSVTKVEKGE